MKITHLWFHLKLAALALLSSLLVWSGSARAHELQPTVADLTVAEGTAELVLRLNIEAHLAEIDLDGLTDTDNAANAEDYDSLRALPAEEIAARAPDLLAEWNELPLITLDGTPVTLTSGALSVPEGIDPELARTSEWTLRAEGLDPAAQSLIFAWPEGAGPIVLRQQGVEEPFTGYLEGGSVSDEIALAGGDAATGWQTFVAYIPVGFDHILPQGLDHILFVLGLFFLSTRLGPLLWQVSAFTLAHTVTLALGALGWVNISGAIVEPLIAASIVYVAVENIFFSRLSPWRPAVVFGFGLLHGLGFASVLAEFGLPQAQFIPALIGFNIGVEVGQLTVIAMAAILIWLAVHAARVAPLEGLEEEVREHEVMFRALSVSGSLLIALIGAWWVIERTLL
jgi:hypothetical protein